MDDIIRGPALALGKNIDTDQIYPGRFLALVEPSDIGAHCLEGIGEDVRRLAPGSIIAAGTNFGCGSSREHAVIALKSAGVKAVLAESFARIFFRNAVNLGLPVMVCRGISGAARTGDVLEADTRSGWVRLARTGETFQGEAPGEHILEIIRAGGIKNMFRARAAGAGAGGEARGA